MTTIEASTVELLETSSVQALSYRYRLLTDLIAIIMVPFNRDERLTALIALMRCEIEDFSDRRCLWPTSIHLPMQ